MSLEQSTNSIGWDKMKMIDLFSGLGGASEAFVKAGWEVMRCENNPNLLGVPNTWEWDLTNEVEIDSLIHMPYWDNADLIWASPPCLDFSFGYNSPPMKAKREGIDFEPDMRPLRAAIKIIKEKKPKYWVIENVSGASKIFSKELGVNAPRQIFASTYYLWGNFPYLSDRLQFTKPNKPDIPPGPLRSNLRALIPYELSQELLDVIMTQPTLEKWL